MSDDVEDAALDLLAQAAEILRALRIGARRAFVLELTGTPKAGKTSALGLVHGFFRRAGFKVHTLKERASDCPIPMKGHFFFNAWTTCTMLAEVLATHDTEVDLILLDRGFFDALIWLRLQLERGQVSTEEAETFERFVLLERWRSLVDLTVVMTVTPEAALEREDKGGLIPRRGSLMNETALTAFNAAIDATMKDHATDFNLVHLDASADGGGPKRSAIDLLQRILPQIRAWAEQRVVVLPRSVVKQVFAERASFHGEEARDQWATLQPSMRIALRHEIEHDDEVVQVIGCGIVVHQGRMFVLRRSAEDAKKIYGRSTLWKGLHIEANLPLSLDMVEKLVEQRVLDELHLKTELRTAFLGIVWDEKQRESRHMGVFFSAQVLDPIVAKSMQDKEFRKAGRGHVMVGTFQTQQDVIRSLAELELESWSQFVVQNIGLEEPS